MPARVIPEAVTAPFNSERRDRAVEKDAINLAVASSLEIFSLLMKAIHPFLSMYIFTYKKIVGRTPFRTGHTGCKKVDLPNKFDCTVPGSSRLVSTSWLATVGA
jgi:hypothetical protein